MIKAVVYETFLALQGKLACPIIILYFEHFPKPGWFCEMLLEKIAHSL
jgi:hypothetical protein